MADLADIGTRLGSIASQLSDIASELGGGETTESVAGGGIGGSNRIGRASISPLGGASVSRLRDSLKSALNKELSAGGASLGLKPGDMVAISSSVGQSISF